MYLRCNITLLVHNYFNLILYASQEVYIFQDLYCVRSDLGNLLKALGRLDEAKVMSLKIFCHSLLWLNPKVICQF
jgi:hypothetical protein